MNLKPLYDRILVKRIEVTRKGSIVLPDTTKEKSSRGKILAIGDGKVLDDGRVIPLKVKVGDEVVFGKYSGTEFSLDDECENCLILREDEILGIIN